MCVFFNMQKGEEPNLLLIFDFAVSLQGNFHLISNPSDIDDDIGWVFEDKFAAQVCDHKIPSEDWASTTAMATMLTISRIELPNCRI